MPHQIGSMLPPLIPLPSPTLHNDPSDPFDSLFSAPGSQSIFVPEQPSERVTRRSDHPPTPSSAISDFGAFVSVPASMDPLQQPLVWLNTQTGLSSPHQGPHLPDFFERFSIEAKERAGQNERRVLNELLEHQDDPLYRLDSRRTENDKSAATADTLIETDGSSLPCSDLSSSLRQPPEPENIQIPIHSDRPSSPPPYRHSSPSPPLHSSRQHSFPHGVPLLTHSSPFASQVYVPPSGAPGLAGDHQWNKAGFEFEEHDTRPRKVELTGRRDSTTPFLTSHLADKIRTHLPALPRLAKSWSLLYSLDQHGVSLQTFYARCAVRVAGTLIAIRDSEDRIFGACMSEQMRLSPGAYYGSGDSFLWKTVTHREQESVEVFKWTGKNDYVLLCEASFISFGGGEGKYGLYLDANLIDGSSARCPTFDNPILCATARADGNKTVPFECVGIESWGVTGSLW
ncbi:TLD-domain-containing protein [Gautieria morchelliformis]|nr:TLD-domain-containing protein [Gautieria morchelliformis]